MMTDERRKRIMAEFAELFIPPPLQPDEFTTRQFQELHGIGYEQARGMLRRAADQGILEVRHNIRHEGKVVNAYRVANQLANHSHNENGGNK